MNGQGAPNMNINQPQSQYMENMDNINNNYNPNYNPNEP